MSDAAPREQANTEAGAVEPGLRVPFSVDESGRASRSRGRLGKLILAKLALDLLFVCALAVYTHAVTFGRGFDGRVEQADDSEVGGWVVDLEHPGAPVEVQLFVNGRFEASTLADEPAPGDAAAHRAFVFRFEQPQDGENEMRVYAVREWGGGARRTLRQLGDPQYIHRK